MCDEQRIKQDHKGNPPRCARRPSYLLRGQDTRAEGAGEEEESVLWRCVCEPRAHEFCPRTNIARVAHYGGCQDKCYSEYLPIVFTHAHVDCLLKYPQIQDEYTFITDLSYALSTRYQRSESSIVVTVTHSCCLLFGGSFDPAYTLTINALPSQLQPVTNKRNAVLLSKAMEEGLGVEPERGLIKFCAIAEDNMANGGKTVAQEIEELERETAEANVNLQRSLSKNSKTTTGKEQKNHRQSMKSLRSLRNKNQLPTHEESFTTTPEMSGSETPPPMPAMPSELGKMDKRAVKAQKMGRRKSFIATIFGRAG